MQPNIHKYKYWKQNTEGANQDVRGLEHANNRFSPTRPSESGSPDRIPPLSQRADTWKGQALEQRVTQVVHSTFSGRN